MAGEGKLTARQARFVEEYLADLNAKQAAIRAGYAERSAASTGYRLLQHAGVAVAIRTALAQRARRARIDADRVLTELAHVGFYDARELCDHDGRPLPLQRLPDGAAKAVSAFEVVSRRAAGGGVELVTKVKFYDKLAALEKLGRHLGLYAGGSSLADAGAEAADDDGVDDVELAQRIAGILARAGKSGDGGAGAGG
jgi:phage terminase small subunit